MKTSEDLSTISHMATFGGRFAQALAQAALAADDENLEKIKTTWPELWHKYATWLKKATEGQK